MIHSATQDEAARLDALARLAVDFDAPAAEIEGLCRVASAIAGAPVALVTLVDATRQRFLANVGLPGLDGTPRDVAFCNHAIRSSEMLVVEDATADPRFADNPLVTEQPGIRAYAGAVIEPEAGMRLGTLCVIDFEPRRFSAEVLEQIAQLGTSVTALLIAHRDKLRLKSLIALQAEAEAELRFAARHDPLTGLLNAAAFRAEAADGLRAARDGKAAALVILDADNFKLVNDRFGHAFGDRYLRAIGEALRAVLPAGGCAGRIGGDEFAVLLPGGAAQETGPRVWIARFRTAVAAAAAALQSPQLGRISAGAAAAPRDGTDYAQLFQRADAALYVSKNEGRNRTTFYDASLEDLLDGRAFKARFTEALAAGEIVPFYQPKIDLRTGAVAGFEVLARWRHPEKGRLCPAAFESVFRDRAIAPELTRCMLRHAARDYAGWRRAGLRPGGLAVNATVYDLIDAEFCADLDHFLAEADLDWPEFTLEVTEKVVMGERGDQIYRTMHDIRARGGCVALDDFGTGHGGLSHLKSWPVDILKIDQAFVRFCHEDEADRIIAAATIGLGQALGLRIVAEGIESAFHLDLMQRLGCDFGQGYHLSVPLSSQEAAAWLAARTRGRAAG